MEKVLNQEEIDAMFRAALGRGGQKSGTGESYQTCDFRQAGQIKKDQVRSISMLHEGFARHLTNSLGAYLRVVFDVNLVSVEQLAFREFLARVPDMAYVAAFQVKPMDASAVLQLDLSLVFPMIDLLLGGVGRMNDQTREITEIEEGIMEGVVRILCDELQTAWSSLSSTFDFEERLQPTQLQRLIPPTEKTLCLSFEIRMPESHGAMNVAFPAVVSNALLRKLDRDGGYSRHRAASDATSRMLDHALEFPFDFSLEMPAAKVPVRQLMNLRAGDVLPFTHRANAPVLGQVSASPVYEAFPMRAGNVRAARVSRVLPFRPESDGQTHEP